MSRDDYASITILFEPDQKIGSSGYGALISALAEDMDIVLSFEVGESRSRGVARVLAGLASCVQVPMKVAGLAWHAGRDPEMGVNGVIEPTYQLMKTKDVSKGIGGALQKSGQMMQFLVRLGQKSPKKAFCAGRLPPFPWRRSAQVSGRTTQSRKLRRLWKRCIAEVSALPAFYVPKVMGTSDAGYRAVSGGVAVVKGRGHWGADYHDPGEYLEVVPLAPAMDQCVHRLMEFGEL